jgi:hypothetical protein
MVCFMTSEISCIANGYQSEVDILERVYRLCYDTGELSDYCGVEVVVNKVLWL